MFGTLGIPSGGGGCAANRPPHQRERIQSVGKRKSVFTAYIKALCNKAREAGSKRHSKVRLQRLPKASPNPPKLRPGTPLGGEMHPKSASDQPRDIQERPRSAQEAPNKCPRGTKSRPRAAKSRPSDAQETPKSGTTRSKMESGEPQDKFLARSLWEAQFNKLLERFCVVVCLVLDARDVHKT